MIVDINRVRHNVSLEIKRWIVKHGPEDKLKIIRSVVASCDAPIIETSYLVEELTGPSPELTAYIEKISLWYGVIEVKGKHV